MAVQTVARHISLKQWLQEIAYEAAEQGKLILQYCNKGYRCSNDYDVISRAEFNRRLNESNWTMRVSSQGHLWWKKPIVIVEFQ